MTNIRNFIDMLNFSAIFMHVIQGSGAEFVWASAVL
jgi:hypothetical protein